MSRITNFSGSNGQSTTRGNDLRSVDLDQFLKLMISELQNQDPLNPMDNSELLQQITQIREIGATNQLSDTLTNLADGQNLTTASTLIGREVVALDDELDEVRGVVDRVSVERTEDESRIVRVHIGDKEVQLTKVREIIS